jgi:hypothetical protein
VLHRDAAKLLHRLGARAVTVARHILAADDADTPWAIRILREAADQSLADDDVHTAILCLRLALRATTDETERFLVTTTLARAEWRVNPTAATRRLAPLRGALARHDVVTFIKYLLWQGKVDSPLVASLMRSDARLVSGLRLAYQFIYGSMPPQAWSRAGELVDSAAHVLARYELSDSTLELLAMAVAVLISADELGDAAECCDRLLAQARRRRAPMWQAVFGSLRAHIALRQGDPRETRELAAAAMALMSPPHWGVLIGYPLSTSMLANTAMGRHEEAAALARHVVPDAMFRTVFGPRYLAARGHHYLATGRPLAASSDFAECGELVGELGLDVPAVSMWRGDLAEAQVVLGRPWTARELVSAQLDRAGGVPDRVRGVSLRVLAATSDPADRPRLLRAALRHLRFCGDRLESARCLVDLAQAHRELGQLDQARAVALRARRAARSCHAAPLVERLAQWSSV